MLLVGNHQWTVLRTCDFWLFASSIALISWKDTLFRCKQERKTICHTHHQAPRRGLHGWGRLITQNAIGSSYSLTPCPEATERFPPRMCYRFGLGLASILDEVLHGWGGIQCHSSTCEIQLRWCGDSCRRASFPYAGQKLMIKLWELVRSLQHDGHSCKLSVPERLETALYEKGFPFSLTSNRLHCHRFIGRFTTHFEPRGTRVCWLLIGRSV
ncbi:hypothetical protein HDV57DRAFT_244257 [Trichoderma longibrachiatum]